ncbi:MAG: hypothetical protein FJ137_12795 [Deltaproteobacteria bacterium]|nr:hypothetical protein [Deltaproteobacteria bacterium]
MPARLLPADFDVSTLPDSERALVEALRAELDEEWTLVPRVVVAAPGKDGEIDLVAVSRTRGAILFEVKGGAVSLQQGRWLQNGRALDKSPVDQVVAAKHALVRRMRAMGVPLQGFFLLHAVCFPDVEDVPDEGLGPGCPARIVFTARALQWPKQAVWALADRPHAPVSDDELQRFLRALCPDVPAGAVASSYFASTEEQMHRATRDMLLVAKGADVNQRLLLTGGPGSGKTAVVRAWVEQAIARGERVAVMCFNKPVSTWLASKAADGAAYVGTFHELLTKLAAPLGQAVPSSPTPAWFADELPAFVAAHLHAIEQRFDTVIVDEGQDFLPHWLALLQSSLDERGPRRLLVAADPGQAINVERWQPPPDMMRLHLPVNLRNSRSIAAFARRFGGGEPYLHNVIGEPPAFVVANGRNERLKRVRGAVQEALAAGVPPAKILVVGVDHETAAELRGLPVERDSGFDPVRLVSWDERDEDSVVCESVRRAKGLEASAVVFVCRDAAPDPRRFGVGVSRARVRLCVIGPAALGETLGLSPAARPSAAAAPDGA